MENAIAACQAAIDAANAFRATPTEGALEAYVAAWNVLADEMNVLPREELEEIDWAASVNLVLGSGESRNECAQAALARLASDYVADAGGAVATWGAEDPHPMRKMTVVSLDGLIADLAA